ncbi:MAG: NuoM family protein [Anaerolineaceae bacterium]|nr:NuoM family protein [Anaerolineaceae bacterium]MDE0329139.1 NuoM family protein [Anaerolineaceae bacterium]
MIDSVFGLDLLSALVVLPALSALLVLVLPQQKRLIRWVALVLGLGLAALAILAFRQYQLSEAGTGYALEQSTPWFELLGASWHVGIDGISAVLVLLTGILTPLAILVSWEIEDRVNMHMALLLFFQTGLMGVFVTLDLLTFFLFWELSLVPMYFLINQWGGPGRQYASVKFMIYSLGGSLGFLLATQLVGWAVSAQLGAPSFDMVTLTETWPMLANTVGATFLGIPIETVKAFAFIGFFVAFAIKVPVWPFHTWLPDAHSEAPTAGSMLLAGAMLKLGAYGFLRLVIPLFPDVWVAEIQILGLPATNAATLFAVLAMLGVVLGAFAAFAQNDIKRLVAYSSVNHMGFVVLGLAVAAQAWGEQFIAGGTDRLQDAILATNGAVLQMFNHGLSAAGMFLLAGAIYHKTHTRDLRQYGGFWVKAPIYGGIFLFTSMASLGLPGLNGFVGEFLIVRGSWPVFTLLTALAMIGLLFTGAYILKGIRSVLHGPFNMRWRDTRLEIETREVLAIAPLLLLMLVTGVWPNWILPVINQSVTQLLGGLAG